MRKAIFAVIEVGALLLVVAQLLPLCHTHVVTTTASVGSESVGGANAWGVLLLALLAALIGGSLLVSATRFSVALVGLLGVITLVIGLSRDLSDARAHGVRLIGGHYASATNVIGIGLYVEIAGALLLMWAAALGFLLGGDALVPAPRAVTGPSRRHGSQRPGRGSLQSRRRQR